MRRWRGYGPSAAQARQDSFCAYDCPGPDAPTTHHSRSPPTLELAVTHTRTAGRCCNAAVILSRSPSCSHAASTHTTPPPAAHCARDAVARPTAAARDRHMGSVATGGIIATQGDLSRTPGPGRQTFTPPVVARLLQSSRWVWRRHAAAAAGLADGDFVDVSRSIRRSSRRQRRRG